MRISNDNLAAISASGIKVPCYDRKDIRAGIAHIGMGHFHRSHFLGYLDELLDRGLYDKGVFEVDIIPSDKAFIDGLRAQDYMYSVLTLSPEGQETLRIIGAIAGYANYSEEPEKVLSVLSSPDISLITLTITEKGYKYLDDASSLDWNDNDIIHDLGNDMPSTAVGCISKILDMRYKASLPVTVMSCDNIPENGRVLRNCVLQFCERKYPEIAEWVASSIAFPCTMVDRITPGTSPADMSHLMEAYGLEDKCPVHSESFRQWVIEDRFCTSIPDFSKAGALIAEDVKPYELMKIRLLNGSHSALSYPSYMMGHTMVHEALEDPIVRTFIRDCYMDDVSRTLPSVPGIDIDEYENELISRFSNQYIADTVLRLASDGSKKIANAILRPLEETISENRRADSIILALALWEYYFIALDGNGNHMPIDDPRKEDLMKASSDSIGFLRIAGLSEEALASGYLKASMERYLSDLRSNGVRGVLEKHISGKRR